MQEPWLLTAFIYVKKMLINRTTEYNVEENKILQEGETILWIIQYFPLCLMGMLWRKRNNCTFNGMGSSVIEMKSLFVRFLFE